MSTPDGIAGGSAPHKTCPLCDAPLDPANPNECPKCDWVLGYRRRELHRGGTPRDSAAMFLSLLPGLGHIYKGHKWLGVLLMLGTLLAIFACVVAATATALWGLLLLPLYWAGVMLHAYFVEERRPPAKVRS